MNKRIFIFTSFYPYGTSQECFLEEEINFLATEFDDVYLVPYCYDPDNIRKIPDNCHLIPSNNGTRFRYLKMLFNRHSFVAFIHDFFQNRVFLSWIKIKSWVTSYASVAFFLNTKEYKKLLLETTAEDIFYFYWGKSLNILSSLFPGKAKMVSRFHGQWDLWEEEYGGYAPLRNKVMNSLNAVVTISSIGKTYIEDRYPQAKTVLYPLGTKDYGECKDNSVSESIRVLSCSTVYPLKRVDLIYRSLMALKQKVEWTHIGGGPDFYKLKGEVEAQQYPFLNIKLLGNMRHDLVMRYLKDHPFDVFINLSTLEGVPVSIMEAISFDIPIVATNVGGTPDVVKEECGMLVSPNPSETEVAEAIDSVVRGSYSPRAFWKEHYSADVNYSEFASFLAHL